MSDSASPGRPVPDAVREVTSSLSRYAFRATFAAEALWEHGAVQVLVAARGADARAAGAALAADAAGLTSREAEVARLLADRATDAEVAAALGISRHTARRHTERVLQKVGVRSRRELATLLPG